MTKTITDLKKCQMIDSDSTNETQSSIASRNIRQEPDRLSKALDMACLVIDERWGGECPAHVEYRFDSNMAEINNMTTPNGWTPPGGMRLLLRQAWT